MGVLFNEDVIPAYNGTTFVVTKVTRNSSETETFTMSEFKYLQDTYHRKYNHEIEGKIYVGDPTGCDTCSWDLTAQQFNGVTWGNILYLGLGLGVVPDYIYNNKLDASLGATSVDVVESNQEIIDYVTWINNNINVIKHDEWTYTTSKKYDIIICDLWAETSDVTQDEKTRLINNYTNNLETDGKIIIPISGETIS